MMPANRYDSAHDSLLYSAGKSSKEKEKLDITGLIKINQLIDDCSSTNRLVSSNEQKLQQNAAATAAKAKEDHKIIQQLVTEKKSRHSILSVHKSQENSNKFNI